MKKLLLFLLLVASTHKSNALPQMPSWLTRKNIAEKIETGSDYLFHAMPFTDLAVDTLKALALGNQKSSLTAFLHGLATTLSSLNTGALATQALARKRTDRFRLMSLLGAYLYLSRTQDNVRNFSHATLLAQTSPHLSEKLQKMIKKVRKQRLKNTFWRLLIRAFIKFMLHAPSDTNQLLGSIDRRSIAGAELLVSNFLEPLLIPRNKELPGLEEALIQEGKKIKLREQALEHKRSIAQDDIPQFAAFDGDPDEEDTEINN